MSNSFLSVLVSFPFHIYYFYLNYSLNHICCINLQCYKINNCLNNLCKVCINEVVIKFPLYNNFQLYNMLMLKIQRKNYLDCRWQFEFKVNLWSLKIKSKFKVQMDIRSLVVMHNSYFCNFHIIKSNFLNYNKKHSDLTLKKNDLNSKIIFIILFWYL